MRTPFRIHSIVAGGIASLALFASVLALLLGGYAKVVDWWLYAAMQMLWHPWAIFVAAFFTHLFSWPALLPLMALTTALFLRWRRAGAAFVLLGASAAGYATELLTKALLRVPRPPEALIDVSTLSSFPSGHAIVGTIFFGTLLYLSCTSENPGWRHTVYATLCALGIFAVSASRVYLGAHWLSDVLGGFAVGVFWLTCCTLLVRKAQKFVARGEQFSKSVRKLLLDRS
jgi:undecaprenyl-diphosphatase